MSFYGGDLPSLDVSVHAFIWEKLQSHGNKIAIVDASPDGKCITYKEFLDYSRKCAAFLQGLGVEKGDYVSIFSSNRLEFAYLMLGVIGSGAILTPYEILYEFGITNPRVVFVDEERLAVLEAVKEKVLFIEHIFVIGKSQRYKTVEEILEEGTAESLVKDDVDPVNDVAMAPYSSGTTGLPKCVLLTHRAMLTTMQSQFYLYGGGTFYDDRAMYHASGFMSILGNLHLGRKIIMEREFQLQKLFEDIEKYQITVATCFTPTIMEMINAKNAHKYDLSSLEMIICAGAPISPFGIKEMRRLYQVTFLAAYAMTEGGTVSVGPITETDPMGASGKIEPGVEVKVIDLETRKGCGFGSAGEIYFRSSQVLKGYLKNAEATATAFDDGWFRTGDIGSIDEQGNLCITGRLKEIIKCKGLQMSPVELESVIIRHPKVADVGVIGVPDAMCGEVPRAFVVQADATLSIQEVHDIVNSKDSKFCVVPCVNAIVSEGNLSDFKQLRGGIQFVRSIPKSPTGKIDRQQLKKMAGA